MTATEQLQTNIEVLTLLPALRQRPATDAERAVLSRWGGWGRADVMRLAEHPFRRGQLADPIAKHLAPDQAISLQASCTTAFYTQASVVAGMWETVRRLGLRPERVLEPAAGTGAFLAGCPADLRPSTFVAVELDRISAEVLGHLHPSARVVAGRFEEADLPLGWFDLVIGNVPFGDFGVADTDVPRYVRDRIHDYFVARCLRYLRPGGIAALITSRGTLDKRDCKVRDYIAARAELLGVVRLPVGTFPDTQVCSDLLLLQEGRGARKWRAITKVEWRQEVKDWRGDKVEGVRSAEINAYVAGQPAAMLGRHAEVTAQYGRSYAAVPTGAAGPMETEIPDRLIAQLPKGWALVQGPAAEVVADMKRDHPDNDAGRAWWAVYSAAKALLQAQACGEPVDELRATVTACIETAWQAAPLDAKHTATQLGDWDLLPFVQGCVTADGELAPALATGVQSDAAECVDLSDALAVCLSRVGRVDSGVIADLLGRSRMEVARDLVRDGLAFRDPAGHLVTAEEYLSGDVKGKLAAAHRAAVVDPEFNINVGALAEVQPADIPATDIGLFFGSRWIPSEVYADFARHLLGGAVKVSYVEVDAFFAVALNTWSEKERPWGTDRVRGREIFEATLNLRSVKVYDGEGDDRTLNHDATLAAAVKADDMRAAFMAWVWQDDDRARLLVRRYNDRFNRLRRRRYDGSRLAFPGMAADVTLRTHQRAAIARALLSPRGDEPAFIHPTGAGKTFECIATAIKGVQIGAWKRALICVPNHLIEQWGRDVARLYPGWVDEVVVADRKMMSPAHRQAFFARVAMGRWPVVICTHSQLKTIPIAPAAFAELLTEEIDALREHLDMTDDRQSQKRIQRAIRKLEAKLSQRHVEIRRDSGKLTEWGDLRFDCFMVDEAQAFKNLGFTTRLDVAGLSSSESQRAFDMLMKATLVQRGGGRVIFATATPVTNTLAELHTMMRFLQPGRLAEMGLRHFDAFAGAFTETYQSVEMKPAGDGYRVVTRLRFRNLPELANIVAQSWDICDVADLHLDLPTLVGGAEDVVSVPASESLTAYIADLADRAAKVREGGVDPAQDNMLKITSDGRKAAMLNGDPASPAEALQRATKIHACAERVLAHHRATAADRGAQLVFCDLYTPRAAAHAVDEEDSDPETPEEHAWAAAGVYGLLRHLLERGGVQSHEIAYIHDAAKPAEKEALHEAVNAGRVRVLIGSTEKMSTGLNVQARLCALHHLDTPWRPDGIIQRNGRALRQGNGFRQVAIHIYVTEGSFDAYMWGLQRAKLEVISQITRAEPSSRTADDVGDAVLTASQVQAIATGDLRILRRVQVEGELVRLDRGLRSWLDERDAAQRAARRLPGWVAEVVESARDHIYAAVLAAAQPSEWLCLVADKLGGDLYPVTDKEAAHSALRALRRRAAGSLGEYRVGEYQGMSIFTRASTTDLELRHDRCYLRFGLTETAVGTFRSADAALRSIPARLAHLRQRYDDLASQAEQIPAVLSRPWPHVDELAALHAEYSRLTEDLSQPDAPLQVAVPLRSVPTTIEVSRIEIEPWPEEEPLAPEPVAPPPPAPPVRSAQPVQLSLFGGAP